MKRQIFPVLILSLVLPWIVSRVFQMEDHRDTIRQNKREWIRQESFSGCDNKSFRSTCQLR